MSDRGHLLAFYVVGYSNVSSVSGIRAYLYCSVVKRNVSKRNSVLLVHPLCIEGKIAREDVLVPIIFLCELRIVIPAVKDCVKSFGLGYILEGVISDEHTLNILKLVAHHIEADRAPLLHNKCVRIERAVAKIPIRTEISKIVGRRIQRVAHVRQFYKTVLREIKRHRSRNHGGRKRGSVFNVISASHYRRIRRSGSYYIHVLAVIRVFGKLPRAVGKRADSDDVNVRRRIHWHGAGVVSRRRNADNIAILGKLCGIFVIVYKIVSKGHIYDRSISLDSIIKSENKVGGIFEFALFVALRLNHKQLNAGCYSDYLSAIHRRGDNSRHARSVSLLVLDQRPVVLTVAEHVVLDYLILGGIVRIFAYSALKFGMVCIDTRIDHRNGDILALSICPDILKVYVIEIALKHIRAVGYRINGGGRSSLAVCRAIKLTDCRLIVYRHSRQVGQEVIVSANVLNGYPFGKSQRGKIAV